MGMEETLVWMDRWSDGPIEYLKRSRFLVLFDSDNNKIKLHWLPSWNCSRHTYIQHKRYHTGPSPLGGAPRRSFFYWRFFDVLSIDEHFYRYAWSYLSTNFPTQLDSTHTARMQVLSETSTHENLSYGLFIKPVSFLQYLVQKNNKKAHARYINITITKVLRNQVEKEQMLITK